VESSAAPSRRRRFDVAGLRAECRELRELCAAKSLATDEELAAYWPGGVENDLVGADAWIYCYSQLARFLGRRELLERTRETARAELEGAVRAAAAALPEPVALTTGPRAVHPKSAYALEWLTALDRTVAAIAVQLVEASDVVREQPSVVLPHAARALAVRTWAWVLTHPGPGLPWDDESSPIDPPEWTAALAPEDLLLLDRAHRQVNAERLRIMAAAFPASEDGSEPSRLALGGFLAGYAHEHGQQPSDIVRRWSLGEVFAASIAASEAHRQAEARAAAKAKREPKPGSAHGARSPRAWAGR
jgi:hypothetical protein